MMRFLLAHGIDPGPLQRPVLAGLISGALACGPGAVVFVGFRSFEVFADQVLRAPRPLAAAILMAAFVASGALYGVALGRAANDRAGGWLFGMVFGFILWIAAPVAVLPLITHSVMAAGRPAVGFFVGFLVWGCVMGAVFPFVHRPLHASLERDGREAKRAGGAAGRLLRREPRR